MLIFRYLSTEVFKSQLAVFLTLMTIFVSQKFVVILADAADGLNPRPVSAANDYAKAAATRITYFTFEHIFGHYLSLQPYLR